MMLTSVYAISNIDNRFWWICCGSGASKLIKVGCVANWKMSATWVITMITVVVGRWHNYMRDKIAFLWLLSLCCHSLTTLRCVSRPFTFMKNLTHDDSASSLQIQYCDNVCQVFDKCIWPPVSSNLHNTNWLRKIEFFVGEAVRLSFCCLFIPIKTSS